MSAPKVYLAGPAVFRPNAKAIGERLQSLCSENGLEGLFPLDAVILQTEVVSYHRRAFEICNANCVMIRDADAIVADISPFRGPHLDCGTAWEIGFALALGKPTFAYVDMEREDAWVTVGGKVRTLLGRIWCEQTETGWRDAHGDTVEDFDLVDNLMIGCSIQSLSTSAAGAIDRCAQHFRKNAA